MELEDVDALFSGDAPMEPLGFSSKETSDVQIETADEKHIV